ncbi:MAG: hypothetical protein C0518_13375 [Opitutus sp.]|nr:hypothetical protein [Opitutus sp.]
MLIVATTAFVTADKHEACRRAGMNAVITKPLTPEKLRAALAEATASWQSVPRVQLAQETAADPLYALRQLAERKGISLEQELEHFLATLDDEAGDIARAIAARDAAAGTQAIHRLVGRLVYVADQRAERLARQLEDAVGTEQWPRAEQLWRDVREESEALRARLRQT